MNADLPILRTNSQRGVALIVSMVMLAVITLTGVMAMRNSRLEWLMTNNSRFQTDAAMRAGSAVREGENTVISTPSASIIWDATPGFYNSATLINTKDPRKTSNWNNIAAIAAANLSPASYIVEYLEQSCLANSPPYTTAIACASAPGLIYLRISSYRVWALASDGKGAARIAQSTFRKIDNPNPDLSIGGNTLPAGITYQRIAYTTANND